MKRKLPHILVVVCLLTWIQVSWFGSNALAVGDYVTVSNSSGAVVAEGGTVSFEGVTAFNGLEDVKLYYQVYDPNGNLISSYNFIKQYLSDAREIYYSHNFTVNRTVFDMKGLYTIKIMFEKVNGINRLIDSTEFNVFVDVAEKPLPPTISLSPTPPTNGATVRATITQGAGENTALLPLTFQYRNTIFEDWKPYTTQLTITSNGTYIYARACTSSGQCSQTKTLQVTNVTEPAYTPPSTQSAPSVYKEESRIAKYYFVGFKKDDNDTNNVPLPSGSTPTP